MEIYYNARRKYLTLMVYSGNVTRYSVNTKCKNCQYLIQSQPARITCFFQTQICLQHNKGGVN